MVCFKFNQSIATLDIKHLNRSNMVTDKESYIQLIEYLTEHLSLFENPATDSTHTETVMEVIEEQLGEQIIQLCSQNEALTLEQRTEVVREVDAILYDLQEIFSGVINNKATSEQIAFIQEFSILIKNIFDAEIHQLLMNQAQLNDEQ